MPPATVRAAAVSTAIWPLLSICTGWSAQKQGRQAFFDESRHTSSLMTNAVLGSFESL